MSTFYLGWGDLSFPGNVPDALPILRGNTGSAVVWGSQVLLGLDATFDMPGSGIQVDYRADFYPAGGGPVVTTDYPDETPEFYNYLLYTGFPPEVLAGVHEITATVGGVPCLNKLVITIVETGMYYGTSAWYAEDLAPVAPAFWTRFINTREIA